MGLHRNTHKLVLDAVYILIQGGAKNGSLYFTVCKFRSFDQIGTNFGTNQRYFSVNITSLGRSRRSYVLLLMFFSLQFAELYLRAVSADRHETSFTHDLNVGT